MARLLGGQPQPCLLETGYCTLRYLHSDGAGKTDWESFSTRGDYHAINRLSTQMPLQCARNSLPIEGGVVQPRRTSSRHALSLNNTVLCLMGRLAPHGQLTYAVIN